MLSGTSSCMGGGCWRMWCAPEHLESWILARRVKEEFSRFVHTQIHVGDWYSLIFQIFRCEISHPTKAVNLSHKQHPSTNLLLQKQIITIIIIIIIICYYLAEKRKCPLDRIHHSPTGFTSINRKLVHVEFVAVWRLYIGLGWNFDNRASTEDAKSSLVLFIYFIF